MKTSWKLETDIQTVKHSQLTSFLFSGHLCSRRRRRLIGWRFTANQTAPSSRVAKKPRSHFWCSAGSVPTPALWAAVLVPFQTLTSFPSINLFVKVNSSQTFQFFFFYRFDGSHRLSAGKHAHSTRPNHRLRTKHRLLPFHSIYGREGR